MNRMVLLSIGTALCFSPVATFAQEKEKDGAKNWVTVKGKIVFPGTIPAQAAIPAAAASPDKATCLKDPSIKTESWVVDPKTKGIRDVWVWIAPDEKSRKAPFDPKKIHPKLVNLEKKEIIIEQPCCRFIPHSLIGREGQTLTINGSPAIAHNAKWDSENNGSGNPIIPASGKYTLPKALQAEPGIIVFNCSIHPWMKTTLKVLDHPYYAVTNEKGEFSIPLVPAGNFRIFIQHPDNGYFKGKDGAFGESKVIKGDAKGEMDLGSIQWK